MSYFIIKGTSFPGGGASSQHCRLIIKGLRESGISAWLLTSEPRLQRKPIGHSREVPFVYMGVGPKSIRKLNSSILISVLLIKRRLKTKQDLVIIGNRNLFQEWPLVLTCILMRIDLYVWAVELESSLIYERSVRSSIKRQLMMIGTLMFEKVLPRLAKGYIVISRRLKEHYKKVIGERKILLSPVLVDPRTASVETVKKAKKTQFSIVYSGTFSPKDGVPQLIEAFINVAQQIGDIELILTGAAPAQESRKIEAFAKMRVREIGLEERVSFVGFVSRERLAEIMNNANILLVCRTNSDFANYGFPWKLGEYCMTGKPIIATDVSDISLYLEDEKDIQIVPPEDVNALTKKIIHIYNNYADAEVIARKGCERAKIVFNYKSEMERIVQFID